MRFDEHFVTGALSNVSIVQSGFPRDAQFSIDSRTLKAGDIFIAIPGEQVDGHHFLKQAFQAGAAGCIISEANKDLIRALDSELLQGKLVIVVPDTLSALYRLAAAWRSQFSYPVIGITGSVGKTSTKELLAHILTCAGKKVITSFGNQNTRIGLSLNILRMRPSHDVAVFEMGISKQGEMAELANLVRPTMAIITGIGHQHMDGLGSLQNIALEKREIFKYFNEQNIGIINGDQANLVRVSYSHPVVKFGSKTTNQVQARKVRTSESQTHFVLKLYKNKYSIMLERPHLGAVFNSLAAATAAYLLNVPDAVIVEGIANMPTVSGRFEERNLKNNAGILINDCYNASPESMKAALLAFEKLETSGDKIAVIGDMLGLGANSPFWHRQIGRFLKKVPSLKQVILVGNLVKWTQDTLPNSLEVVRVPSWQDAVGVLETKLTTPQSLVLVKGSLGVGLSNLVQEVSMIKTTIKTAQPALAHREQPGSIQ
jgi:UDP-N-acetylmuramoyl-tripeptide--D-alanyl-D-alanine ligase